MFLINVVSLLVGLISKIISAVSVRFDFSNLVRSTISSGRISRLNGAIVFFLS